MFKITNPLKKIKNKKNEWAEKEVEKLLTASEVPKPALPLLPKIDIIEDLPKEKVPKMAEKHQGLKWKDKVKLDKNPTTTYLITMIFSNGSCEHLVAEPDAIGFFKHRKRKYHINPKNCIWDSNENTNRLFFQENYVEPLEIKEVMLSETGKRMVAYVSPENVDGVIKMESLRLIAEGPDLQKWIKIGTFVSIAVLCILLIIMIVFIAQSGIFQQISGSLMGARR